MQLYLIIRAMMNLMWWLIVMERGIPLTHIKSVDKVTIWCLSIIPLGMLM